MNHNVTAIGFATSDPTTFAAVSDLSGNTDIIAATPGDMYVVIESVGDYMAITSNLVVAGNSWAPAPAPTPVPGDTITVVGSIAHIPDYQRGMTLVLDNDLTAHFPNAGHLAAAFSA